MDVLSLRITKSNWDDDGDIEKGSFLIRISHWADDNVAFKDLIWTEDRIMEKLYEELEVKGITDGCITDILEFKVIDISTNLDVTNQVPVPGWSYDIIFNLKGKDGSPHIKWGE